MTSSLVGSEMCIRDSTGTKLLRAMRVFTSSTTRRLVMGRWWCWGQIHSVSYTHLTLPTICSV
eukprot:6338932-Prorocentrum_lima.AAC.1